MPAHFCHLIISAVSSVYAIKLRAVSVSSTPKDFQTLYEGECTVTFGQNSPKLNSRPVYCSRLYGTCILTTWKIKYLLRKYESEQNILRKRM